MSKVRADISLEIDITLNRPENIHQRHADWPDINKNGY